MQIILTEEEYNNLKFAAEKARDGVRNELSIKYSKIMTQVFEEQIEKYKFHESYQRELYKIILLYFNSVKEEIDKPND